MAPRAHTLACMALLALVGGCGAEQRSGEPAPRGEDEAAADTAGGPAAVEAADTVEATGPRAAEGSSVDGEAEEAATPPPPPPPITLPDEPPTFQRPEHVRGVYVNAWSAGSGERMESLIRFARATEVNSFVIDVKDVSGRLSYSSGVRTARITGAVRQPAIRDPVALLERLAEEGIYPIARIVIVRDPVLTRARPHLAIQHRDGGVWTDDRGERWLDPYRREVWEYHVEIAKEALRMGFPEIQWDYVRFPDAPRARRVLASYSDGGGPDPAVIRAFLQYAREELEEVNPDVQITADVFGVTTRGGDVGIGQRWGDFIDVLDVALPMVYPSHYWTGSYGVDEPNAHPYFIVRSALRDALWNSREVEGAGTVRPWLQDFDLGEPAYGVAEVRAQMYGAYDAGVEEWVFWNPSSRYTREAYAPAWGWAEGEEPPILVGGRLVPVHRREAAMTAFLEERAEERLAEARADSVARGLLDEDDLRDRRREERRRGGDDPFGRKESWEPPGDTVTLEEKVQLRVLDPDSLRKAVDSLLRSRDTIPPDTVRRPPGG